MDIKLKQAGREHYEFRNYATKNRIMSRFYQMQYIHAIGPKTVLDIGPGDNYLKDNLRRGFDVKTLDIEKDNRPDIVGSVEDLPLKEESFDLVCCFEVLEHLPFNRFEKCLRQLQRVSRGSVLLSLPYARIDLRASFKLPLLPEVRWRCPIPLFFRKHRLVGAHYWEMGKAGYSEGRLRDIISKYFFIREFMIPYENTYNAFYRLFKK